MAVISDAFHLKQRVTEAFGIVRSKFIGPPIGPLILTRSECAHLFYLGSGLTGRHLPRTCLFPSNEGYIGQFSRDHQTK
jgi:hypothetical protein